jgi:hypothetical protein
MIYFFASGIVSLGAVISGYCMIVLSIIMILYIILFNLLQLKESGSNLQILLNIVKTCGPFLLMLFTIGFILYLVITFKERIISGRVANGYTTFSNIIIIMILLQVYLVYNSINTNKFEIDNKIPSITTSILYLYGVITIICTITMNTILNKFSADG